MTDFSGAINNMIHSAPGVLAGGAAVAACLWKCCERIDNLLKEETKLEIALWLSGLKTADKVANWPRAFVRICDRIFGPVLISWPSFQNSALVTLYMLLAAVALLYGSLTIGSDRWFRRLLWVWWYGFFINLVPNYLSVVETRWVLRQVERGKLRIGFAIAVDAVLTFIISFTTLMIVTIVGSRRFYPSLTALILAVLPYLRITNPTFLVWFVPAFATSIWLWLYAGAGFLLGFARRFDLGFDWFNRKFDIEKKPLQSMGIVMGGMAALVYWTIGIAFCILG